MLIVESLDHWLWHYWWQTGRICAAAPHTRCNRKWTLHAPDHAYQRRWAQLPPTYIPRGLTVHILTVLAVPQEGVKNGIPGAQVLCTKALNLACILPKISVGTTPLHRCKLVLICTSTQPKLFPDMKSRLLPQSCWKWPYVNACCGNSAPWKLLQRRFAWIST